VASPEGLSPEVSTPEVLGSELTPSALVSPVLGSPAATVSLSPAGVPSIRAAPVAPVPPGIIATRAFLSPAVFPEFEVLGTLVLVLPDALVPLGALVLLDVLVPLDALPPVGPLLGTRAAGVLLPPAGISPSPVIRAFLLPVVFPEFEVLVPFVLALLDALVPLDELVLLARVVPVGALGPPEVVPPLDVLAPLDPLVPVNVVVSSDVFLSPETGAIAFRTLNDCTPVVLVLRISVAPNGSPLSPVDRADATGAFELACVGVFVELVFVEFAFAEPTASERVSSLARPVFAEAALAEPVFAEPVFAELALAEPLFQVPVFAERAPFCFFALAPASACELSSPSAPSE
jgi:hypothetical protein